MPTDTVTLPKPTDFPSELHAVIHPIDAQPSGISNVLLFLPGLGDTSTNFANFARALNLPDTLSVTLQGPFPLPLPVGPGCHWSDDLQFDQATGTADPDSGFTRSAKLIANVISEVLIGKHGFKPSEIHLFGVGQGGSVALAASLHPSLQGDALGGITSLYGPLPLSASVPLPSSDAGKNRTPVMLLGGSRGTFALNGQSPVKRIKEFFEFVEYHQWKKVDDSMPKNRDEVLPMMQFWGRRLRSRRGVPKGAVEVG